MIPVPASWRALADTAHAPAWGVRLLPVSGAPIELPAVEVELRKASGGWPRTTATVSWPADTTPAPMNPSYLPYGSRAELSWSPDRGETPVLFATVYVSRTTLDRPAGMWTVECVDGSGMIDEDNIIGSSGPYGWAPGAGQTIAQACEQLVHRTFPAAPVTVAADAAAPMSVAVPATFAAESDRRSPWDVIDALTDLVGCEAFVTADGGYRFRAIPDLGAPVDNLGAGLNIIGYTVEMNSAWNTILMQYTKGEATVLGVWQDTRADSPLAVQNLGRRITYWQTREGTPTQAQANQAAAVKGERAAGYARALSVTVVGRPWLEAGDTVSVAFLGGPVDNMLVTFAEHGSDGTSRLGLRNYAYTSQLPL